VWMTDIVKPCPTHGNAPLCPYRFVTEFVKDKTPILWIHFQDAFSNWMVSSVSVLHRFYLTVAAVSPVASAS
jgi:hypothetical protein